MNLITHLADKLPLPENQKILVEKFGRNLGRWPVGLQANLFLLHVAQRRLSFEFCPDPVFQPAGYNQFLSGPSHRAYAVSLTVSLNH